MIVKRDTGKTRIRKIAYKNGHRFTVDVWHKKAKKYVDVGHEKTLKVANKICDSYE